MASVIHSCVHSFMRPWDRLTDLGDLKVWVPQDHGFVGLGLKPEVPTSVSAPQMALLFYFVLLRISRV